jgi:pimeloyl-ACP methyl ester carboxylesterase
VTTNPDYSVLDRAGAASTAFYPRGWLSPPPPGASDHALRVAPGVQLGARLYTSDPTLPTIVYFHGNGEVASDHDDVAPMYFRAGANLLVIEFRGYGSSNGTPTFANLISDAPQAARLAHELLDERRFSPRRFVMGRSMGAHSALEIAANEPDGFLGVILESGAGNLKRWVERLDLAGEGSRLLAEHEAKIRSIRLPVLMIHGEVDELIPLDRARELYGMLDLTERELLVIPGAGHNDIVWIGHAAYFTAIGRFVASAIRRREPEA